MRWKLYCKDVRVVPPDPWWTQKYISQTESEGFWRSNCNSLWSLTHVSSVARLMPLLRATSSSLIVNFKHGTTVGCQKWPRSHVATVTSGRCWRWLAMLKKCLMPQLQQRALMFSQQSCLASGRTNLQRKQICSMSSSELPYYLNGLLP